LSTVSIRLFHHLCLKRGARTADEVSVGAEKDAAQQAVEELAVHYQAKARAVSRAGVAIGAFAGVLVGSVPLSPLRAAWPIPSSYGFATLLGGLIVGVLLGHALVELAEQARLQLQLEQRISRNDACMAQLLTALTARAAAAAQREAIEPAPAPPLAPAPAPVPSAASYVAPVYEAPPDAPPPRLRTVPAVERAPSTPPLSPPLSG